VATEKQQGQSYLLVVQGAGSGQAVTTLVADALRRRGIATKVVGASLTKPELNALPPYSLCRGVLIIVTREAKRQTVALVQSMQEELFPKGVPVFLPSGGAPQRIEGKFPTFHLGSNASATPANIASFVADNMRPISV